MSAWYPLLSLALTVFILLLFVRAALHKVVDFVELQGLVADYELVPEALVKPVSVLLTALEGVTVALLLIDPVRAWGLLLAFGLLALYGMGIAINLRRGRTSIDCGCGGAPQRLGVALLWRNLALGAMALLPLAGLPHALSRVESAVGIASGVCLWLLYALLEQARANQTTLASERRT